MWFLNGGEATTGSSYSMRVEPLSVRLANDPDPSKLFVSGIHGDPGTPLLRAYLGDPILVRALVGSANEVHTWHVTGHWFPMERYVGAVARAWQSSHGVRVLLSHTASALDWSPEPGAGSLRYQHCFEQRHLRGAHA